MDYPTKLRSLTQKKIRFFAHSALLPRAARINQITFAHKITKRARPHPHTHRDWKNCIPFVGLFDWTPFFKIRRRYALEKGFSVLGGLEVDPQNAEKTLNKVEKTSIGPLHSKGLHISKSEYNFLETLD